MFFKKYGNLIVGVFFMLLAVAYFCLAEALPKSQVMAIGPAFVPKIVACLTFALAFLLTASSLKKLRAPAAAGPADGEGDAAPEYMRVLLTIAAFGAYVFAFEPLGFMPATFLYLAVQIPVMAPKEKRNFPLFLVIAAATSGIVYYLFKFQLNVMLPAGLLG